MRRADRTDTGRGGLVTLSPCHLIAWSLLLLAGCDLPGKPKPDERARRPADVLDFATLYRQNCAACHGADGRRGAGPPLNDRLFLAIVPDEELRRVIADGRPGTLMPAFLKEKGGTLTAEQVRILADGIKPLWGSREPPAESTPPYLGPDSGGNRETGARVFARACAGCHGAEGKGGYAGAINDFAFLALSSDQVLRRYIITGRSDLKEKMPSYAEKDGRKDFRPLTSDQVSDLVALLAYWRQGGTSNDK
jgi:mono/diheme cytochrome c family protein